MSNNFQTLVIEHYTPHLQPPFAYHLNIEISNEELETNVKLSQHFFGREDFTKEELEHEGFSNSDDFNWNGKLNDVWIKYLGSLINRTALTDEEGTASFYLEVISKEGDQIKGYPNNNEEWTYIIQEFLQAIFELAKVELPLQVQFVEVEDKKAVKTIKLQAKFSERKVTIEKSGSETSLVDIEWNSLTSMLDTIFTPDYNPEAALQSFKHNGYYISFEEGIWFPLPGGIEKPAKNLKKAEAIINLFTSL